ncbi:MAG TPA: DUF1993 domain-containing protein [Brevundimonas sp.]|jgi:hypothetical protein|uniref:DUF1993 domain-containing protein n=1 Tax=Brevundimonas sp. TaxID=1871086 RepID=UPI002DF5B131|nr:DUF1993 domain-containing protein [Brevundimonas sp.]
MTISLYELSVPTFLQTLRALRGVLARAARHCAETGADPNDFVEARLVEDMAPFHFQIEALWHHAVWGMEAARTGVFDPPPLRGQMPFADLQATLDRAIQELEALDPGEVNRWAGRDFDIVIYRPTEPEHAHRSPWGPQTVALTPETYLLTYALPNFYFHVVTAYAILRMRGAPIGKGDYEGDLHVRTA